ncbi:transcription termination/antitermination factor NusG [Candidatus Sumerlaeota bacterium]|nr:transcription termination/antitermination factor NusG [Candidatus Sumerlaeota bacterium]
MAKEWFAVHTYSGFEQKVKTNIEHLVTLEDLRDDVAEVIIPQENLVEIKGGKKRTISRNLMPGYILAHMEPSERVFDLVKKINGVSGFVGDGTNAIPLSQAEVDNILNISEEKIDQPRPEIRFRKGEQVKVIEGPFANFVGTVEEIDEEKSKLKVMVSIFGRPTAVELNVLQVEGA